VLNADIGRLYYALLTHHCQICLQQCKEFILNSLYQIVKFASPKAEKIEPIHDTIWFGINILPRNPVAFLLAPLPELYSFMLHTSTIRQILSDQETGLLPYLRQQLQQEEFSQFKAQLGFHVDEFFTTVNSEDSSSKPQTTLFITLKLSILVDPHTNPDDATLYALEFQQMLDVEIINWSQHNSQLLNSIQEIKGTFSNLEEIPYHGGYLPGFEMQRKFALTYAAG
jgi:hypothetical protein